MLNNINKQEQQCNTCNKIKFISEFPKNGKYIRSMCKSCKNEEKQNWLKQKTQIEININQLKKCTLCNIEKNLNMFHKSKEGLYGVKSFCKDCKKEQARDHYINNREYHLERKKEYYNDNKEKIVNRVIEYRKHKIEEDSFFKMKENIRCLIRNAFVRQYSIKSKKTREILGCSFEEFRDYIEKQFDNKMNWDNQGSYWHLDHIKPVSLATTEQEIIKLNHYTNFQPLFWKDNLSKSNKY